MARAFLLRFQEPCLPAEAQLTCGTRTETKTYGEDGDADPRVLESVAVPRQDLSGGTKTENLAGEEARDANCVQIITRLRGAGTLGTKTETRVHGEADDKDYREGHCQALPRCS